MEEDTEYKKLPVDERCVHKLWKARLDGYEELIKIFRSLDDEKAPEWNKYGGLVKKFVIDSHAMAQERGLEATLIFVENAGNANKTVGDVVSGLVNKCFSAPKARVKDLAFQIVLMYIEIEKQDATIDELVKGLDAKNPKIVAATISILTQALREFGNKVVAIKPFIKKIPVLLADRDKNVRDGTKQLTIEIFRWIGPALRPHIASIAAVLLTELEGEFEKVKNEKAEPTRYLKSQQEKQSALKSVGSGGDGGDVDADDEDQNQQEEVDPMDLIDPVDILSKLPKDFYEKLEAKKWQERKESLEALQTLLQNPKLESGDYGDVVKALKKVLTKDTNVVLVAMAGKCLACLAKGLGKKFSPYALACVSGILEKFKEKKANVVTALREAIDAIYPSTTLEALQEELSEALNNKNPSIKAETASFLARAFARTQPATLNKKLIKALSTVLLKTLSESDPTVRDTSAEALGTLLKLLGEKAVGPYLVDVDALKMAKIKECSEKAEIFVKTSAAPKKERPTTAPVKSTPTTTKAGSADPKPVARPASGAVARKPGSGPKKVASNNMTPKLSGSSKPTLPTEREMTPEEADEKAAELLSPEILSGLVDSNWKTRLSTAETFLNSVDGIDAKVGNAQALVRMLCKKPGLKETNFQVLKLKLDALASITEKLGMTTTTAELFLTEIVSLLADTKNSAGANQVLTAVAEAIQLEYVITKVIAIAFEQKSPKVQAEALNWVANAIKEFGMQVNPKALLDDVKKSVQSINPAVRQAAIQLLGIMHLYMGNTLAMLFDGEKPALKQQIQAEFDKNADQKPPKPSRGVNKSSSSSSVTEEENDDDEPAEIKLSDMLPRVDISPQITEALLAEMSDKNWKTRNEGLTKLQAILNEARLIKPSIGDLPLALSHRLVDSNAKIAQTSMAICQQLAEAMGPNCKQHVRVLFPGFLNGLSDSKAVMRLASIQCMNAWGDQCGFKEFFDGEMIAEALKSGSPALRTELWAWLSEKLPTIPPKTIPKDEILACLPYLYANILDRNADVRKNANDAVLACMLHVGYEPMFKALEHQKPASKSTILAALDKARPSLPVKPLPKGKLLAPVEEKKSTKTVAGKAQKASAPTNKPSSSSRKKEEDVDSSPLLSINNLKNQRMLDEQKLKVLKWTFTTPREEFTELLRDQMTTAGLNKNLMANMFHDDFRYHLKVIEALQDDLNDNQKALICNLDLILKWISLRFYDTNPSVLLKGLDYLNVVMQMLIANEYDMSEVEGTSFLPHLLVKLGDPKDAVRNGVRSLFRQICLTYPFTKVFACIMDGLKSKNARQRTECLDELGYLIETYGMGACQPSPQIALKEIARHIADRDNSVRSAALNCVVQAYFLVEDRVYKLIGQLSEKDLSMLDERIKRAKKTRKVPSEMPMKPVAVVKPDMEDDEMVEDDEHEEEFNETPPAVIVPEVQQETVRSKPSGPFKLDQDFINEIEKDWVRSDLWQIPKPLDVDTAFLYSPLKSADVNGVSYPADRLQRLISTASQHMLSSPVSHTMNYAANTTISMNTLNSSPSSATTQNLPDILPKLDPNLMRILRSVGSTDTITARAGLNELNDILESSEKQAALRDYEEIYIENVCLQLKNLSQIPVSDALAIYQPLLSSIYSFYTSRTLGKNVGIEPLKKFMALIIGLMVEQKLPNSEENEYTKVVNGICLKIFDKSNFTNIICALIRLLKETCSGAGLPKFTDLLMKCIWRNVKNLPEKSNEIDYDAVLLEVHEFMVQLPSSYWHQRHVDTPYRTVKTIIHHLAQIKGNNILQHLTKIPQHSELYSYLLKVLKNLQKDNQNSGTRSQSTPSKRNTTVQSHEAVSAIFKLISDKETKQEGIQKLYEFKIKNPDVDIDHYLHGSNPIFRKFIDDGLADLERAAAENNLSDNKVLSENRFGVSKTVGKDADYWMERLNALKKNTQENDQGTDNRASFENLNVNLLAQKTFISSKETTENLTANRLELMKQRLAQVRSQK